jgi:hypothetical protein
MKRVYLSSTTADLEEFRVAVSDALRNCGYDIDWMERYAARDDRPRAACEMDVAKSDYYVGIFAWRYGYVPEDGNPEGRSITELEYLAAGAATKPRFIFLLDDAAPWSSKHRDAEQETDKGQRIRELRNRLKKEQWASFFHSPDNLAKNVLVSLLQHEATKRAESLKPLNDVQSATDFGPSFLPNIGAQMDALGSVEFVSLSLGPTPWWNTRLHLAAALASDFTEIKQFLVLNAGGGVELIAPPIEVRRALAKAYPKLETAYHRSRELPCGFASPIDCVIANYNSAIWEGSGLPEKDFKVVVSPATLRELGVRQQGEVIEQLEQSGDLVPSADIVRRRAPFLVLVRNGKFVGIVDRVQIASRLAQMALS